MTAPFDYETADKNASAMDSKLREADEYCAEIWADPALGPLMRLYAMFTHFPNDALGRSLTDTQVADYRAYTYARMARLHARRDGCECMEIDGMDDILSELDSIADQETMSAIKSGESDANRQYLALKEKGIADPMSH